MLPIFMPRDERKQSSVIHYSSLLSTYVHIHPYMYFYVYKCVVYYTSQDWLGYAAVTDNLNDSACFLIKSHTTSACQKTGSAHPSYSVTQTDAGTN